MQCEPVDVGFDSLGLDFRDDYEFKTNEFVAITKAEAEVIETAAATVQDLVLRELAELYNDYALFQRWFPEWGQETYRKRYESIKQSWDGDAERSLYGRFDFAFDGKEAKLYEYNADTPTTILEASLVQWVWLENAQKSGTLVGLSQFNEIYEKMLEFWRHFKTQHSVKTVHFAYHGESVEDRRTVEYLAEICQEAGQSVALMEIEDLGVSASGGRGLEFFDLSNTKIEALFKLYPYEDMWNEPFASDLFEHHGWTGQGHRNLTLVEPMWKIPLTDKNFLAMLYERNPTCPYLLPTYPSQVHSVGSSLAHFASTKWTSLAMKPRFGRGGEGVEQVPSSTTYDDTYIAQAWHALPQFDGVHIQTGVWMVDGEVAGLGFRGDKEPIIVDRSAFYPHVLV
ncbi:MAG: glutathionylspermidine synthase family protein [Luteolibacter sp.]